MHGSQHVEVVVAWFGMAVVWLVAFCVSFLRDRRRLRNGVYLVLALGFFALGALVALGTAEPKAAAIPILGLTALVPLMILALAGFLIANGVTMLRREGRSPGNLLSLLVGLGIVGLIGATGFAWLLGDRVLFALSLSALAVAGYLSFVFCCFLLYSVVYGRIRHRRKVDFVVVLGAGLLEGTRVSSLLAGRLDRARAAFAAIEPAPFIVVSGGQGPDEVVSEARAMADYLVAAGVPGERILLEDRSATTFENLAFSRDLMAARRPGSRCVVVTSNYHVLRAALTARRAKVNGQVIGSRTAAYFLPSAILREFAAVLAEHRIKNIVVCVLLALPMPLLATVS